MIGLIKKLFGSRNDREVRKLWPRVKVINDLEAGLQKLSDDELRQKTADWKARLAQIEDKAELAAALEEILPEAFAVVKNACRRLTERKVDVIVREHPLRWEMIPLTCSSLAASVCIMVRSLKWPPAKAKRSSGRCPSISMR
jgi:preprotein translocase subunit SecA